MVEIVTVTVNPAIDISTMVERLVPFYKMRCDTTRHDPGGGGINVARVLKRFDMAARAIFPFGGAGQLLCRLVTREGVVDGWDWRDCGNGSLKYCSGRKLTNVWRR